MAAGPFHDIDFARLEILKLLAEDERIRVRVFEDFENRVALGNADVLISYTCNLMPSLKAQQRLRDFVRRGGQFFALHGSNSVLEFLDDGRVATPDSMPVFSELLGSRFLAHPTICEYTVCAAKPEHPLIKGLPESFTTKDEQYLIAKSADVE
ncbi:MAG: ThuA domain-containing protein, partial [Pseudomonadota bacterium]